MEADAAERQLVLPFARMHKLRWSGVDSGLTLIVQDHATLEHAKFVALWRGRGVLAAPGCAPVVVLCSGKRVLGG